MLALGWPGIAKINTSYGVTFDDELTSNVGPFIKFCRLQSKALLDKPEITLSRVFTF